VDHQAAAGCSAQKGRGAVAGLKAPEAKKTRREVFGATTSTMAAAPLANLRFRMPEGVDIGAYMATWDTRGSSGAVAAE